MSRRKCLKSSPRLAPLDEFASQYISEKPPEYTIEKLHELISDPLTNENEVRIVRLLDDFLRDLGNSGYKIGQLTRVMQVLEFLGWEARSSKEYQIHLERMLELCKLPPLLEKTSDYLHSGVIIEQYFSTLGNLMVTLPTDLEIQKILEALKCLLVRENPVSISCAKLDFCKSAMEKSRLPLIVTKLTEICSPFIHHRVLELTSLLARISNNCCYRMLKAGILENLLMRINESANCDNFDHIPQDDPSSDKERMILTTNIMWSLIQAIFPPRQCPPELEKLAGPSLVAMRNLRTAFRCQVSRSQGSIENLTLRNDLATLILAGSVALPRPWQLVRCGIAEDIALLSTIERSGIVKTWTENISFDTSNENLMFKKILLTILCHLSNQRAAITIMSTCRVISAILKIINPEIGDHEVEWSPAQFWYLSQFAMRTLGRLATKMPEEFARNKGPARLLMLVEWSLTVEFDTHLVMEYTKTICSIIMSKCPSLLTKFRQEGIAPTLTKLVNRILTFGCFTMQHQRILTLLVTTMEEVTKKEDIFSSRCDDQSLIMITSLLQRCFYQRKEDFPLDQRLLVAIGSYIWKCVIPCPEMSEKFVDDGGIYTILDVIENACFPVRCLYLGIITDLATNQYGAPHLCTWRGVDKTKGIMSLLAKTWREEEIRTGVKRTSDGRIEDVELPMMGTEQWISAFHSRAKQDFSPALASMLGSVRPKIYSIRKIMINEADRYQRSKEHYKILLNVLPVEDQITMYIADHFYRFAQGQLWSEVSRYLEQIGVNLLGMDGEIMLLMNQRHGEWGMYVRGLQDKYLMTLKKRDIEREREEYSRIRNSRLGDALKALEEIDYIRRTSDHRYLTKKKEIQRESVNEALKFPALSDAEHCHRTFDEKWNVTTISDNKHRIPSVPTKLAEATILPVSPTRSFENLPFLSTMVDRSEFSFTEKCSIKSMSHITRKKTTK